MKKNRSILIVQRRLTDYRVPLFERLRELLAQDGVELRLLHGEGTEAERKKGDSGYLGWAEGLDAKYLLSGKACWLPFGDKVRGAELVVVPQENRLLYNLLPLFVSRPYRMAFWGHGANLQAKNPDSAAEKFKRMATTRVDWWFAYTEVTIEILEKVGFPLERVTNLQNSIDTRTLRAQCDAVSPADTAAVREELRLGDGPVGLYLGSLYPEKRLDFLLDAGLMLAERVPGFRLVIAGDGPQRELVQSRLASSPWLRYVGRRDGQAKAVLLKTAEIVLNPGLVGLGILDGFVAGAPIFTTDCHLHSPEISYLSQNVNGVITSNDVLMYVDAVTRALTNPMFLAKLRAGSLESGARYTIDGMAANFRDGVLKAIA